MPHRSDKIPKSLGFLNNKVSQTDTGTTYLWFHQQLKQHYPFENVNMTNLLKGTQTTNIYCSGRPFNYALLAEVPLLSLHISQKLCFVTCLVHRGL